MGYLLAALAGGFVFFNSQASPRKAAGRVETVLRQRFPGAQVDVDIRGKRGANVLKGRFREVKVEMASFQLAGAPLPPMRAVPQVKSQGSIGRATLQLRDFNYGGLKAELAEIEVGDVVYDWDALKQSRVQLLAVGPARARLIVPAASLLTFLQTKLKDVKDARLTLQNGLVRLSGTRPAPFIGTPLAFTLTARPEVRKGTEIWLAEPQVALGEAPLPPALIGGMLGQLNPIFIFDRDGKWPFHVNITSLLARDNKLEIAGNLIFVPANMPALNAPKANVPGAPVPNTPAVVAPPVAPTSNMPAPNALPATQPQLVPTLRALDKAERAALRDAFYARRFGGSRISPGFWDGTNAVAPITRRGGF